MIYNTFLFFAALLLIPKFLWDFLLHKKYRSSFLERFGIKVPNLDKIRGKKPIWIHAVSLGEVKAAAPFIHQILKEDPKAVICLSTTTETGQAEAKKHFPHLGAHFFLPLDFSFIIRRLVKQIDPQILILVEGDFWYHLLKAVPQAVVINGKISEASLRRFQLIPSFSRKLFSEIDFFCVQNETYQKRFISLGVDPKKIGVTGNLKLDHLPVKVDKDGLKKELGIQGPVVTLASTHAPEEEELLAALERVFNAMESLTLIVVPRHPERFDTVASLLEKKGISFFRYSERSERKGNERILLVDALGILTHFYQISDIAIVGGSFGSHVGGHNVFEPAALGIPTLFGPHMASQKDLVKIVVEAGIGFQVELTNLGSTVKELLSTSSLQIRQSGRKLGEMMQGSTLKTWTFLKEFFNPLA